MINVCDYKICTGCGLCAAECPKNCISMAVSDGFGHVYPKINQNVCIDCGLCQKNCPAIHPLDQKKADIAYAAWSKDEEEYKSSTSGAVASVLSYYVLSQGGIVYGCAMLPDVNVKHIRVDKIEDVKKLKGSKYVQSTIVEVIPLLKRDVKEGRLTLFIGTPCQVGAVKRLFKVQPDNLLLVDLICHGVPSLQMLSKYVHKVIPRQHYDKIIFRDKEGKYVLNVYAYGVLIYSEKLDRKHYKGWYVSSFFEGFTYRDSCYKCHYAIPERCSDITIGDFWGLGKKQRADEIPEHRNGISVVLPITCRGIKVVEEIKPYMNIYKRPVDEAIDGNSQLNAPVVYSKRISHFRKLYPIVGHKAYRLCWADVIAKVKIKSLLKK